MTIGLMYASLTFANCPEASQVLVNGKVVAHAGWVIDYQQIQGDPQDLKFITAYWNNPASPDNKFVCEYYGSTNSRHNQVVLLTQNTYMNAPSGGEWKMGGSTAYCWFVSSNNPAACPFSINA